MIRNLISRFMGGGTRRSTTTRGSTRGGTAGGGVGARIGAAAERFLRRR